uniref:U6 snRNA m(6)A methyltransferase n=1 Tax=Scylla olivacea TaxID=85551 RepID=A0A0P4VQM9_SCYOL
MATKKKTVPPKLNKFMHPRNPYRTPPSFKKLATQYPEFRAHCAYDVAGKVHLDFKNPDALRALTTCLLNQDFGLEVNIPSDRLVPTLPLRLNYLLWLEDLLFLAARRCGSVGSGSGEGDSPAPPPVVGVDIGTGAACVYPLLAAAHFSWCMLATETDPASCQSALENVQRNGLAGQIAVRKVEEKTILKEVLDLPETLAQVSTLKPRTGGGGGKGLSRSSLKSRHSDSQRWGDACSGLNKEKEGKGEEEDKEKHKEGSKTEEQEGKDDINGKEEEEREEVQERDYIYDFTMTNPPFFSSEEEADTMAKSKKGRGEPNAAPTGTALEKVTEGGEVEFIRQMVEESQLLRDKVRIFTTLIGTKAHVREVKRLVQDAKPTSCVFTEFCQGRTMRWGAAWTFAAGVSLSEVRSKKEMATKKPIVLLLPRTLMSVYSVPAAWTKVLGWLKALKVKVEVFKSTKYFVSANVKAFKLTWLHQRRRRREREREGHHQQHNGKGAKEEEKEDKGSSSKRKTEDEEESENKRARIETEGEMESETGEEEKQNMEEEEEEELDEEEELEEEENHEEGRSTDKDSQQGTSTGGWGERKPTKGGLKCLLRCNFQVKQTGGLISVEAHYLGGSLGKDGLNQLVQYMRNQLTYPHTQF